MVKLIAKGVPITNAINEPIRPIPTPIVEHTIANANGNSIIVSNTCKISIFFLDFTCSLSFKFTLNLFNPDLNFPFASIKKFSTFPLTLFSLFYITFG